MNSEAGKGDKRHPFDQGTRDTSWDRIFGNKELPEAVIKQYEAQQLVWKLQGCSDSKGGETE